MSSGIALLKPHSGLNTFVAFPYLCTQPSHVENEHPAGFTGWLCGWYKVMGFSQISTSSRMTIRCHHKITDPSLGPVRTSHRLTWALKKTESFWFKRLLCQQMLSQLRMIVIITGKTRMVIYCCGPDLIKAQWLKPTMIYCFPRFPWLCGSSADFAWAHSCSCVQRVGVLGAGLSGNCLDSRAPLLVLFRPRLLGGMRFQETNVETTKLFKV